MDLKGLTEAGFLGRGHLLSAKGQAPYSYHLTPKAKGLLPWLGDCKPSSGLFKPIAPTNLHGQAVSSFCAQLEGSMGSLGGRVELLAGIYDGHLKAPVLVKTTKGKREELLIPDYTYVLAIDGKPELLFLELQNKTPLAEPRSPGTLKRSFRHKLNKYKGWLLEEERAFAFGAHPFVTSLEADLRCRFHGFRVLIVTTQGGRHLSNLISVQRSKRFFGTFLFTSFEQLKVHNLLSDPIWSTAIHKSQHRKTSILNPPGCSSS